MQPLLEGGVVTVVRTIFVAALGVLILVPLWSANRSMDALLGHAQTVNTPLWPEQLHVDSRDVAGRLGILRTEIRADLCHRGGQRYCLAGVCLSVPLDGCAQK